MSNKKFKFAKAGEPDTIQITLMLTRDQFDQLYKYRRDVNEPTEQIAMRMMFAGLWMNAQSRDQEERTKVSLIGNHQRELWNATHLEPQNA